MQEFEFKYFGSALADSANVNPQTPSPPAPPRFRNSRLETDPDRPDRVWSCEDDIIFFTQCSFVDRSSEAQ